MHRDDACVMFVLYLVIVPGVLCTLPIPLYHLHVHYPCYVIASHSLPFKSAMRNTLGYP